MKVKALREHNNTYGVENGAPVRKSQGTEYELPEAMAETLIAAGLAEKVAAEEEAVAAQEEGAAEGKKAAPKGEKAGAPAA